MKAKVDTANTNTEGQDLQKLQKKNLVEAENNHQVLLILVTVMENLS